MTNSKYKSLLIVDDDSTFRNRLKAAFDCRGFNAVGASSGAEAIAQAKQIDFQFAIVDLRMPNQSGLDLLSEIRGISKEIKIIVLTGYGSIATAVEAVRRGAINYLTKPTDIESILTAFGELPNLHPVKYIAKSPSLEEIEWEHINRVLVENDGNISKAAKVLGLHRRSLQRKLCKLPARNPV